MPLPVKAPVRIAVIVMALASLSLSSRPLVVAVPLIDAFSSTPRRSVTAFGPVASIVRLIGEVVALLPAMSVTTARN